MTTRKEKDTDRGKGHFAMNTPPIVSHHKWEVAHQQLLAKEKALTRSRDALVAERRRIALDGCGQEVQVRWTPRAR